MKFQLVNNKIRKKVNTMSKFKESELSENLKEFQNKCNIEIKVLNNDNLNIRNINIKHVK